MKFIPSLLILILTLPPQCESAAGKILLARDGKKMMLIPGGTFRMGSGHGYSEESPVHSATVKSFYMDQQLVTNREFRAYCDSTNTPYPENPRWEEMPGYFLDYPEYPVVNVSLEQAKGYASWAEKRIPTETEWEYAACGGLDQPVYPWGNEDPDASRAKFADRNSSYDWRDVRVATPWKYTAPVGSFMPNGYGLFDMAGNVYQWTVDWFFRYDDPVRDTVQFEDGWGGSKVVRGGCYYSNAFDLRVARRRLQPGGSAFFSVGFRCVKDVESDSSAKSKTSSTNREKQTIVSDAWKHRLDSPLIPTPSGLRLCLGEYNALSLEEARRFKNAGFSSVEFYVTWESVEGKGKNQWDFSAWDKQLEILKKAGLKWTPFIIAGPAYSLPAWYRNSKDFVGLRCLEHNIESKVNTIWDTSFYYYVDRFLARVAKQYGNSEMLDGVLLGICGDFGEAIYPVWHGGWPPTIAGLYHSHAGYWCGDRYARASFIEEMKKKFKNELPALNAAWGTSFASFDAVAMPPVQTDPVEGFRIDELTPRGTFPMHTLQDRRRWVDFVEWYRGSMTRHANEWMRLARSHFADIPVYLCTGGDANPSQGSNFAEQCKIASESRGGIRITNESTDYGQNFCLTNWVTTASHLYGNQFGFEPAGGVLDLGVVSRIYNAAASGVNEFMSYSANIYDREDKMNLFLKYVSLIATKSPVKDGVLLYPDLDLVMDNINYYTDFIPFASMVRDYSDIQFADDLLIEDGVLDRAKWMIVFETHWLKKRSLDRIIAWVKGGGLLIAGNTDSLCAIENGNNYFSTLFNADGSEQHLGKGATVWIRTKLPRPKQRIAGGTISGEDTADGSPGQYQSVFFDPATRFLKSRGMIIPDGKIDRVFTAANDGRYLILNHTREKIYRSFTFSSNDIRQISLQPNSITEMPTEPKK